MNKKCALILSDTGPLITLAFADSLDLLLKLNMPIYIVDEVYYEASHNKKFKDAKKIEQFIKKEQNSCALKGFKLLLSNTVPATGFTLKSTASW